MTNRRFSVILPSMSSRFSGSPYSYELEKQLIAALLCHPSKYIEISPFISPKDFVSEVNCTIFSFLKAEYDEGNFIDEVILSERIKLSGISFEDNLNVGDYLRSLKLKKASESSVVDSAKELAKLTLRRKISGSANEVISKMKNLDISKTFVEIIDTADTAFNSTIEHYDNGENFPQDIFSEIEEYIELQGNNPQTDPGIKGPHFRVYDTFGSILSPGNITTIVARTGVGKTQFQMDYCRKVLLEEKIPVLHLDNGEMSKRELMQREAAALSGVEFNLIKTGLWRRAGPEIEKKVRAIWPLLRDREFYYQNVGGMSVDSMIQLVKHFYYAKIKRGNPLILSFDYIKTTSEKALGSRPEYQVVGEMVDKFKKLVQRDVTVDGEPMLSLITSVQSNRIGITQNRTSDAIVEDESIISLSDRISQFSSHVFSLRRKTLDELAEEENGFGTHRLTCLKYRHLGKNGHRHDNPVRMPNGDLKRNFINLNFENFNITEIGDLQDMVDSQVDVSLEDDGLFSNSINI